MANPEHLTILKQGVKAFNDWREKNPNVQPNLNRENLSESDLISVNFSETGLHMANLYKAKLMEANLTGSHLFGADLKGAKLVEANLSRAELCWANLKGANLRKANLNGADLTCTNLRKANLKEANLSRAVVNEHTLKRTKRVKNGKVGINGIWAETSDTAALMTPTPPGDSMLGSNPEAVMESLKRARRLHGFSMTLVGIVILISLSSSDYTEIPFPYFKEFKISVQEFGLLAMFMSTGLLSLVASFMSDALKGVRYLQDRQSSMSVGNFPWVLSKYSGGADFKLPQEQFDPFKPIRPLVLYQGNSIRHRYLRFKDTLLRNNFKEFIKKSPKIFVNWLPKPHSFITRFIMSFHPLVYLYFIREWNVKGWELFNIPAQYLFIIPLLLLSSCTFIISQRFQKPILFDQKTEEEHQREKANIEKAIELQTEAVVNQIEAIKTHTKIITELVDSIESKNANSSTFNVKKNLKE